MSIFILLDLQEALIAKDKRNKHTNYVSGKYRHCFVIVIFVTLIN